jgi:DNA end-binding protein Ku
VARALWKGSLSFGLVSIPIEIHTAVRDRGPRFHLLRRADKSRIQFQRVAEKDGEVVDWDDIVKGYEYEKGRFIVLTKEDFESAAVNQDRMIDILDFVEAGEVDDRYFDKPYYLLPAQGGKKAYALLREVIKDSGRIGIAKFVMRDKQHLAAIEAIRDALVLSTMRFSDELVKENEYAFPKDEKVRPQDLKLARMLVGEFSAKWDASKYTDDYRRNIMEIIESRRKHQKPDLEVQQAEASGHVVDLMERLQRSLGAAKAPRSGRKAPSSSRSRAKSHRHTKRSRKAA